MILAAAAEVRRDRRRRCTSTNCRSDDIRQGNTQTHCGRGLIMDPTAYVVTDADSDLEHNQASGAESIEIHISLTSILLVCIAIRYLIKI